MTWSDVCANSTAVQVHLPDWWKFTTAEGWQIERSKCQSRNIGGSFDVYTRRSYSTWLDAPRNDCSLVQSDPLIACVQPKIKEQTPQTTKNSFDKYRCGRRIKITDKWNIHFGRILHIVWFGTKSGRGAIKMAPARYLGDSDGACFVLATRSESRDLDDLRNIKKKLICCGVHAYVPEDIGKCWIKCPSIRHQPRLTTSVESSWNGDGKVPVLTDLPRVPGIFADAWAERTPGRI